MIQIDQLRELYRAAMQFMPPAERDLIKNYFLDEQKELAFRRLRGMSKKDFVACMASALTLLREYLQSKQIESVSDVF